MLPDTASCFWFLILPTTPTHSFLSRTPSCRPRTCSRRLCCSPLHHKLTPNKPKRVIVLLTAVHYCWHRPPTRGDPVTEGQPHSLKDGMLLKARVWNMGRPSNRFFFPAWMTSSFSTSLKTALAISNRAAIRKMKCPQNVLPLLSRNGPRTNLLPTQEKFMTLLSFCLFNVFNCKSYR